jgi:hypothetical protein
MLVYTATLQAPGHFVQQQYAVNLSTFEHINKTKKPRIKMQGDTNQIR